ncbi:MAG: DNA-directed RNA polymerase subunit L [Thermoproteota archaeon]
MDDVIVRKLSNKELEIEFIGEGHTFYNLMKEYLLADDRVEFSAYKMEHPLTMNARLYVRAKKQPEAVVLAAATKLAQDMQLIEDFFEKM